MLLASSVYGAGQVGTPLVILHGLFGSARNWASLAKRLAQRQPVHTVDLRNHGASPWSAAMDYQIMAEDVAGFIEDLGGAPVALLGHSMGGKVAMMLALNDPWLVDRLLVLDIAPVRYPRRYHDFIEAMLALPFEAIAKRSDADDHLAEIITDAKMRDFLLRNLILENDRWRWRINLPAIDMALGDLLGFPELPPNHRFDGSTLFLRGGQSAYVQPEYWATISARFPSANIETIDGAGHWVHVDAPEAVITQTRRFLGTER